MLQSLTIRDFRCVELAELELSPTLNLILGPNASGKTSLLEAMFFLGRARSFRTPRIGPLIREGAGELLVSGRIAGPAGRLPVGIRRSRQDAEMRLGEKPLRSLAALAEALPIQVMDPTVHGLLDDGPRERRRFLDWGVFHVEHGFREAWQRYNRAMRQRNLLLRAAAPDKALEPWEHTLAEAGTSMDVQRRSYLSLISPMLKVYASNVLDIDEAIFIEYQQGWPQDIHLAEALRRGRARDRAMGSTQAGPHRADIVIRQGRHRAQGRVSRGQQKVLAGVLVLAQLEDFRARTGRAAILLADDLSAELDPAHLGRFLALAEAGGNQLVITAIRPESLPAELAEKARVFHVERGVVKY